MNQDINPQLYARIGGALYLLMIALGLFQEAFVRGRITFANLQQMQMLWRLGIASELLLMLDAIALAVILYVLTRPVHRELALLGLVANGIATAVESSYAIQLVQALFPLGTNAYLSAFTPAQLQAMTALAMKSHVYGFGIGLLLYGPYFFATGYLIYRSGFWPKLLGVLYELAGAGYVINTFILVLAPRLAGRAFLLLLAPAFVGEFSFALWLLIQGVRIEEWRRVTGAAAPRSVR
jgi:hypothetical protein